MKKLLATSTLLFSLACSSHTTPVRNARSALTADTCLSAPEIAANSEGGFDVTPTNTRPADITNIRCAVANAQPGGTVRLKNNNHGVPTEFNFGTGACPGTDTDRDTLTLASDVVLVGAHATIRGGGGTHTWTAITGFAPFVAGTIEVTGTATVQVNGIALTSGCAAGVSVHDFHGAVVVSFNTITATVAVSTDEDSRSAVILSNLYGSARVEGNEINTTALPAAGNDHGIATLNDAALESTTGLPSATISIVDNRINSLRWGILCLLNGPAGTTTIDDNNIDMDASLAGAGIAVAGERGPATVRDNRIVLRKKSPLGLSAGLGMSGPVTVTNNDVQMDADNFGMFVDVGPAVFGGPQPLVNSVLQGNRFTGSVNRWIGVFPGTSSLGLHDNQFLSNNISQLTESNTTCSVVFTGSGLNRFDSNGGLVCSRVCVTGTPATCSP
jgi:hypothetical protein